MATDNPQHVNNELITRLQSQNEAALLIEAAHNVGRIAGQGEMDAKWQYMLGGMNRLPNIIPAPTHKELQGLVLFTRPSLNLSGSNIAGLRYLSHLLTTSRDSTPHAIRRILDPELQRLDKGADESNLVDMYSPYISLLTNTIVTMSQPPDIGTSAYTSPEGIVKEQWIMNEGIALMNGKYDLTCTFDNIKGAAVLSLFHTWLLYMTYLRIGTHGGVLPYPKASFYGVMDYFTRIERFKFDESGRKVVQWFHTGASFPTNLSIGAGFAYNREEAYDTENKTFSVQFASVGAVYQDPIQLVEFNMRHERFNPMFKDETRSLYFKRIDYKDVPEFNYVGYPRINLVTHEMEWWVPAPVYKRIIGARDPLASSVRMPTLNDKLTNTNFTKGYSVSTGPLSGDLSEQGL